MIISNSKDLNLLNNEIHDWYFDIESLFVDRNENTLKIRFSKNSKLLSLYKECKLLIIKNVTIVDIIDSTKIRYYDLNEFKYNSEDGFLSITSGFPVEIRIRVSDLNLELGRCEHEDDGLVKELFVEQASKFSKSNNKKCGIFNNFIISYKNRKEKQNYIFEISRKFFLFIEIEESIFDKILLSKNNSSNIEVKLEKEEIDYISKILTYRENISKSFKNKINKDNLPNIFHLNIRDFYAIGRELLQELLEYGFINGRITSDGDCFKRPGEDETNAKEYMLNSNGKMLVKMINRLYSS